MMWLYNVHVILVTCLVISPSIVFAQRKVTVPPLIVSEPSKVLAFREQETIELPCLASGEPQPTYKWQMNEKDFDPSGNDGRIAIRPGEGTLIFAQPLERDEAIYQCFAENQVGTALTVKVDLRKAILEPFQQNPVRSNSPYLGRELTLRCVPPRSFPQPEIFWVLMHSEIGATPVDLDDRITMDPEGNLNFVNIQPQDAQGGRTYACFVQNKVMREIQQGEFNTITPLGQTIQGRAPGIMWSSPNNQVALRGQIWRVKCIFSGSPTPMVEWVRLNEEMPSRARKESYGQELVIENVQYNDTGTYECQGINRETLVPIRKSYTLYIESAPYWIKMPMSVDAAEHDKAEFHCETSGIPEPINYWYLNGVPMSLIPEDPRRIVEKTKLTFLNMSREDAQVVQCNSTNKHGYMYANAYLNVLVEPPIILTPPEEGAKAAEGQTVNLTCEVFGSPVPLVVWWKGNEQLTGGRFRVMPEGHLEIDDVSLVDAGTYTCSATNYLGHVNATGTLIVRRKTEIRTAPLDVMVYEGTEAKFTCTATTDPEEVANIEINWKRDGTIINYQLAQRVFRNTLDNSLTISGAISLDTGKYTCVASNGLDEDEASAQLIVQAPPDPPNNVHVLCRPTNLENTAEINWQPGKENYAPILNFMVQYNTTFTPDTWTNIETNISQNERRKEVILSPYANYTFRVLARNKIGISNPSMHTVDVCRTEPDRPTTNPENVIGEGDLPNNLVIFWTPMPFIERNGQNLKYILTWTRLDNNVVKTWTVDMADSWHYLVPDDYEKPYIPFYITVKATNGVGESTSTPTTVMGYSGEAEPENRPTQIEIKEGTITADSVILMWPQVDTNPELINGFFRGYRVEYGRTSDWPENTRQQDVILQEPLNYPRPRIKRDLPDEVEVKISPLPQHTQVTIEIRVLNKYYAGPPSDPITFNTLEGLPEPPSTFQIVSLGSTHFELKWTPPYRTNGILVGYNMSYQQITGLTLGRVQYRDPIDDPNILRARLTGLLPNTLYRVFLSGATQAGKGEPIFLDMKTAVPGEPSAPTFDVGEHNDTWAKIVWEPSRLGNPGSVFYVQYRKRNAFDWQKSADEVIEFHIHIYDLIPGTTYQVRVVSKNGDGDEAPTAWLEFKTWGVAPGHYELNVSGWFYGIWISLFLIIVLIVLFMVAKRTRDDWWVRKEMDLADQVRHLQAQEAALQLGALNEYADVDSQIVDPLAPFPQPYKDHYGDTDDEEEGEDSEDEYGDDEEEDKYDKVFDQGEGNYPKPQFGAPEGYGMNPSEYPSYGKDAQGYGDQQGQQQGSLGGQGLSDSRGLVYPWQPYEDQYGRRLSAHGSAHGSAPNIDALSSNAAHNRSKDSFV